MFDMGLVGTPLADDSSFVLRLQFRNGSGVASNPDSTPTAYVYSPDSDTPIQTVAVSSSNVDSKTGFRKVTITPLANAFAAGTVYTVQIPYAVSSVNLALTAHLQAS